MGPHTMDTIHTVDYGYFSARVFRGFAIRQRHSRLVLDRGVPPRIEQEDLKQEPYRQHSPQC